MDRVAAVQVDVDRLDDQLHQVAVGADEHRDEEVALEEDR